MYHARLGEACGGTCQFLKNELLWLDAPECDVVRVQSRGVPSGAHVTGRMCGSSCADAAAAGNHDLTAQVRSVSVLGAVWKITWCMLRTFQVLQARGDFIGCRDSAMFLVGWAGMFRCSELAAMDWRSVHFVEDRGVMLYVPSSKTDQVGEGAWVFVAQARSNSAMCPVRALRQLQQVYGGAGAVFRATAHGKRISRSTLGTRLQKALKQAGVADPELYSAHSLRRGGATHASKCGMSSRMVQRMGRWKSDVVQEYLYTTLVRCGMQLHSCRLVCSAKAGAVGAVKRVQFGPLVCREGSFFVSVGWAVCPGSRVRFKPLVRWGLCGELFTFPSCLTSLS